MNRAALVASAALAGACAVHPNEPPSADGVTYNRSTRRYTIDMSSPQAMSQSIFDARQRADQRYNIGQTQSSVQYTYVMVPGPAGCTLESINVISTTTISIPRWSAPSGTSSARREWWQKLEAAITLHERRHVEITEDGARRVAAALRALTNASCDALSNAARVAGNAEMARTNLRQQEFDRAEGPLIIPARPP